MPKLMPGADVWFHPGVHELQLLSNQPLAAKVTYVHHSGLVNLIVWGKGGETFQRASVPFWDADHARYRRAFSKPKRETSETDDAYNARVNRVVDRPATNHASWINEGDFEAIAAPEVADVTRHPFEGRPSGGFEDLERARSVQGNRLQARAIPLGEPHGPEMPAQGFRESDDAYKVRQAELDAKRNMDHGRPRGSASPNSGGPLAMDDHGPLPDHPEFADARAAQADDKAKADEGKAKADKESDDAKAKSDAKAKADKAAKVEAEKPAPASSPR